MTSLHRSIHADCWQDLLETLPEYMRPGRDKFWERNKNIYIRWMEGNTHSIVAKEFGVSYVRVHHVIKEISYQLNAWRVRQKE